MRCDRFLAGAYQRGDEVLADLQFVRSSRKQCVSAGCCGIKVRYMASKIDNAATFRSLAAAAAFSADCGGASLLCKAGGGSPSPEAGGLVTGDSGQARARCGGEPGAFDELDAASREVARLRVSGGAPGSSADWQQLESRASAILRKREEVEAY